MKSTVIKFPQIVAEALAKADCALAGEVYQAIMAHELFGVEPTGLSAGADALYTLCMQFVSKPKCKAAPKEASPAPEVAVSASPVVADAEPCDTVAAHIEETPAPRDIPAPIFPDLDAPRVTTLQSAPRPGIQPPKSPERRQRYINRVRGKRKSAPPQRVKVFFKNHTSAARPHISAGKK